MPGGWRGEEQGTENRDLELEPKNMHKHNSCAEGTLVVTGTFLRFEAI